MGGFSNRTKKKNIPITPAQLLLTPTPDPNPTKKQATRAPRKSNKKTEMTIIIEIRKKLLLDEFFQIKTYFRKGERPAQLIAIENFEKHLKEINLIEKKV